MNPRCGLPGCGAQMIEHEIYYPHGHSREWCCPHGDESSPYHQKCRENAAQAQRIEELERNWNKNMDAIVDRLVATPNPFAFNDWDGEKWVWGHRENLRKVVYGE